MKNINSTKAISEISKMFAVIIWSLVKHHNSRARINTNIKNNLLKPKGANAMERTATAMKNLVKEGWYDYKKGTEFRVLAQRTIITLVEDSRGHEHWFKTEDLAFDEN